MKKTGFTLAEILIALAIVGIVAAMTIPTFVGNGRNQAMASKLSTTVNAFENALTSMIAKEGVDDLTETEWVENDYTIEDLGTYIKLNGSRGDTLNTYYDSASPFKDLQGNSAAPDVHRIYETKNGALILLGNTTYSQTEESAKNLGSSVNSASGPFVIDVNGVDKPNVWGRDVFYFLLGDDGHLYPGGGLVTSVLLQGNNTSLWRNGNSGWTCNDEHKGWIGCTARLMENNYKVDY